MKIIRPYACIIGSGADSPRLGTSLSEWGKGALQRIEWAARISHRSEESQTADSWRRFLQSVVLDHGDWSVVEHVSVTVDAVVDRGITHEWVRHRIACVPGDSVLYFDAPSGQLHSSRRRTANRIDRLYYRWMLGGRGQERIRNMRLRMCNEDTGEIEHTHIADLVCSGVRRVFKVTLDNGYSLKMSKEERLLTNRGWRTLQEAIALNTEGTFSAAIPADLLLAVNGTKLNCVGNRRGFGLTESGRRRSVLSKLGANNPQWRGGITPQRQRISNWTTSVAPLVHKQFNYTCQLCGERGGRLEAHHLDPVYHNVSRAYDFGNLMSVHAHCHKKLEGNHLELLFLDHVQRGLPPTEFLSTFSGVKLNRPAGKGPKSTTRLVRDWAKVASVEDCGEEMTFDAMVTGPFQNLVVNGFVVHNSYTQESTRFVNYERKMPPAFIYPRPIIDCPYCLDGVELVRGIPEHGDPIVPWSHQSAVTGQDVVCIYDPAWLTGIDTAEQAYKALITKGWRPQEARSVFPNALASRIVTTANLRSWRHFFLMRTTAEAHPQMRQVTIPLLVEFQSAFPLLFDDIVPNARQADNLKLPG